ncbi:hypothetical protein DKX38_019303 [Salix brachista]|uniref:NB-ARC domain-containing protein n=1 Tax=Salix brachista TaxID=2182728 RepID=A0A5N5KFV0_9ROSI|nr:hypothetical protein DKX38_019303 [Salix brachista]
MQRNSQIQKSAENSSKLQQRLELDDVGIPSGSDNRGCKILMTSRDRNALCGGMDTKKLFHLQVLLENEAWNLFKNMAGDAIKYPDLQLVAVEVAKRCAGLPILLVTVASALKDGDLSDWKDALERLKRFDKEEIDSRVYSALELSYTSLKGEEIKSVFLLCGQLRPHGILILDLLKYTIGLGLFKRISTLEEARHRLHKLTIFLPVVGLVDPDKLKPGDLVGVTKDSYLILDTLPHHLPAMHFTWTTGCDFPSILRLPPIWKRNPRHMWRCNHVKHEVGCDGAGNDARVAQEAEKKVIAWELREKYLGDQEWEAQVVRFGSLQQENQVRKEAIQGKELQNQSVMHENEQCNGLRLKELGREEVPCPNRTARTVIPNLEELSLNVKDAAKNMEKLVVTGGLFKELFPCQLVDEEEHTLARIRCLELFCLPYMEKIWNQDLRADQLLQNLETLEVRFCDNLINFAPSASSFGNLTALHVRGCQALKYLVTSSTARSLVQLSVMSIQDCKMVTEIVASNGDEAGNEINFRKLESLKLDCLESLTSFCSVDFTFRFPCLTEVIVTNCPKMKTFPWES